MREIKIRNISEEVIARLDRKAKEMGISREEFLREQLLMISLDDEIKKLQDREAIMFNKLSKIIDLNTKVISAFMQQNCLSYEEIFEDE